MTSTALSELKGTILNELGYAAESPLTPQQLCDLVQKKRGSEQEEFKVALWELIESGEVQVTSDWKLRKE